MNTLPGKLLPFLWYFSKKHSLHLLGLIFVAIFWAIDLSLSPYMVKLIIDGVSSWEPGVDSLFYTVGMPSIAYVALALFIGIVFRFYDYVMIKLAPIMKNEIILEMFNYIIDHSYSYFQQNFSGSLSNKINDISKGSVKIITEFVDLFLSRFFCLIAAIITMYLVHASFAITLTLWTVLFISISLLLSRKSQEYSKVYSESKSHVMGKIVDCITNVLNIKLFARKEYEKRYLKKYLDDAAIKDQSLHWYLLKLKAFQALAITLLIAFMLWLLINARIKEEVTIGDFALILGLTMSIVDQLFTVAQELINFSEDLGTCSQALSIISTPHDLIDAPNATTLNVTRGEIIFDKVHFRYRKGHNIFTDKSIIIHSGEKVGFVGFSGSGKSTFINLILRFFSINSGKILIDGQDITTVTQDSLRSQIAMIPQDPILFHRSLMENIRYGKPEASDEEVIESSKKAHCHEFIEKLKGGYSSLVGERGIKLSGGQRQRIAIARAILKDAPILILDEATSSLDSITENYIQESLTKLMENRTTIVVAHRLSTLFNMDRILVFNHGKVVEEGNHQELIANNSHYAKLWNMQAGGFLSNKP
ncbi:MAG: ABC transporter ATP-binding protein [Chlamydiales bacterium]|nr:ABC transporter ATP-binding protein [Chlamydiales bacterium]